MAAAAAGAAATPIAVEVKAGDSIDAICEPGRDLQVYAKPNSDIVVKAVCVETLSVCGRLRVFVVAAERMKALKITESSSLFMNECTVTGRVYIEAGSELCICRRGTMSSVPWEVAMRFSGPLYVNGFRANG